MGSMLHYGGAIIVEGRYDKARLCNLVDCPVIVTNGFGVFKDKETAEIIRFYAKNGGIIILTDSDSAGFRIRGYIRGIVPQGNIKNAYIPDIYGKEKRKTAPSAEGKLGVEGVPDEVILCALRSCIEDEPERGNQSRKITRLDLYEDGLSGGKNSALLRQRLLGELGLPQRLPAGSLEDALNRLMSYEEYKRTIEKIKSGTV